MLRKTEDLCQNRCVCGGANISCDFQLVCGCSSPWYANAKNTCIRWVSENFVFWPQALSKLRNWSSAPIKGWATPGYCNLSRFAGHPYFEELAHFSALWKGAPPSQGHICRLQLCTKDLTGNQVIQMCSIWHCFLIVDIASIILSQGSAC